MKRRSAAPPLGHSDVGYNKGSAIEFAMGNHASLVFAVVCYLTRAAISEWRLSGNDY
jgi:hypothetical protein